MVTAVRRRIRPRALIPTIIVARQIFSIPKLYRETPVRYVTSDGAGAHPYPGFDESAYSRIFFMQLLIHSTVTLLLVATVIGIWLY